MTREDKKVDGSLEQCTQIEPREIATKIARNVGKSPFTDDILEAIKPRRFVTPMFQKYDGTTDPVDHINGYKQKMCIETIDEKLICKLFPSSLTGSASTWFQDLKPSQSQILTCSAAYSSCNTFAAENRKRIWLLYSVPNNGHEKK